MSLKIFKKECRLTQDKGHIRRAAIVLILASNTVLLVDVTQQMSHF